MEVMDVEDEASGYLFNENSHNFLLHNSEDVLTYPPMFADWSNEVFPILLEAPLIGQTNEDCGQVLSEENDQNSENIPSDTVFISNDVLLQVETNHSPEVIELLNIDGSITTINKNFIGTREVKEDVTNLEKFYSKITANKCSFCDFLCEADDDIKTHLKASHSQELSLESQQSYTLYLCSNCGGGHPNKEVLRQHMITAHNLKDTVVPPEDPKPKNAQKSEPVSVLKKQKSLRIYKCSIKGCPLRFDKADVLKSHENCHVNKEKRQFMCPVCKEKFSIWRICNQHLWKSHKIDVGLITCPMCGEFKSNSRIKVVNHMAIHKEEKPFMCSACGKTFKQLNQLKNHEVCHTRPEDVPDCYNKKKCDQCNRVFANRQIMKKHIKYVHDKYKPFICNICGHQAARKEMLQVHHRQHTGDKPFHCNYCDYKTADKNCLRRHSMRHFGLTKYSCPYCPYKSIQATSYKQHLSTKHPDKQGTYSCPKCRYKTINLESYLSHVKCHDLEPKNGKTVKTDDRESKSSDETPNFLNLEHDEVEDDTGGITIPAV